MEEQNVILGRNPVIEAIKSGKQIEKYTFLKQQEEIFQR